MQHIYTNNQIKKFQSDIWKRRALHRRDLPWRHTTDPYKIWISETMLCQTQVSRVIVYYNNWLKQFPTVEILAQATPTDVLSARSGLGYNSRGLRVLQAAKDIISNGGFPNNYEQLVALPGVGDYVSNAILAFAHNHNVAVIDTNIRRILIYHFGLDQNIKLPTLKKIALDILPIGYASDRYNALMDYGALELTSKKSGISPLTRQSKFEGSRRQVRAWIIKQLIIKNEKGKISNHTDNNVGTDHIYPLMISDIQKRFSDRDDVENIVKELIKEGVIEIKNEELSIKN